MDQEFWPNFDPDPVMSSVLKNNLKIVQEKKKKFLEKSCFYNYKKIMGTGNFFLPVESLNGPGVMMYGNWFYTERTKFKKSIALKKRIEKKV